MKFFKEISRTDIKSISKYILSVPISRVLFTLYITFVCVSSIFQIVTYNPYKFLILLIVIMSVNYILSGFIMQRLAQILCKNPKVTKSTEIKVFIFAGVFCFLILYFWYLAYLPGSFSQDAITQYSEAISGKYGDWHPVWHTLIFFTLPLKITGKLSSIVLFQIVYFSLAIAYMAKVVCKHIGVKFALISVLFIVLNPYTDHILLNPWKDVGFAIVGLVIMTMAAEIYFDQDGSWSAKKWHLILFGFLSASATIFRHNGVLFTLPLLFALFFHMQKKHFIVAVVSFVVFFLIIKIPIYGALKVEKPSHRVLETVGLPLTVIGNLAKENPNFMDQEMKDYVYAIATPKQWQEDYQSGSFNTIKGVSGINYEIIDEKGSWYAIKMMLRAFQHSQSVSLRGFFALTDQVYGINHGVVGFYNSIAENNFGINADYNEEKMEICSEYTTMINNSFLKYLEQIGVIILIMLSIILSHTNWKNNSDITKLLLCLPIFVYDFGTMLLLSGADSRFFYITFVVCPITLMLMLRRRDVT